MGDVHDLKALDFYVKEANEQTSSNYKIEVLNHYPEIKWLLWWTYNPMITFGITSEQVRKKFNSTEKYTAEQGDLGSLLGLLSNRELTGFAALHAVNSLINDPLWVEYKDLILKIIDRNLETRSGAKQINEVYPGLIPSFNVALANKFDKFEHRIDWINENWLASRKLDGVRLLIFIEPYAKNIKFFSRRGKEFFTLDKLKDELKTNIPSFEKGLVLDGELCIIDENGDENFQDVLREVRRKDHTIDKPMFQIFDAISMEEFTGEVKATTMFHTRRSLIQGLLEIHEYNYMKAVPQIVLKDPALFLEMRELAHSDGWEGVMLRKDNYYKGKRSNDLLKAKYYIDAEYDVVNVVFEDQRIIVGGEEITKNLLSSVTIKHKGCLVSVGSGFSKEQRIKYKKYPELLMGATITVRYFEETRNDDGGISLRFPVIKAIYEQGRDM